MKKKLQIFVSSTYTDLLQERQAAVEAILKAGHIPAGMELFAAGSQSQIDTIKRWIDDSDIFLLILGGRYGSIDPTSGKSYTELEYEYAASKGMPLFAIVISQEALDRKVKSTGQAALELANREKYEKFRQSVLGRICRFFEDEKDVKLSIHESLFEIIANRTLSGWVSGKDVHDTTDIAQELAITTKENHELRRRVQELEERLKETEKSTLKKPKDFKAVAEALDKIIINTQTEPNAPPTNAKALELFIANRDILISGVNDAYGSGNVMNFFFYKLAPTLVMHGLMEEFRTPGAKYRTLKTSELGNEFLAWVTTTINAKRTKENAQAPAANSTPTKKTSPPPKEPSKK